MVSFVSTWLGHSTQIFSQTFSRCSREVIFLDEINVLASGLWIKQITLCNRGCASSNHLKARTEKGWLPQGRRGNVGSRLPSHVTCSVSSSLSLQPAASTAVWASSLYVSPLGSISVEKADENNHGSIFHKHFFLSLWLDFWGFFWRGNVFFFFYHQLHM